MEIAKELIDMIVAVLDVSAWPIVVLVLVLHFKKELQGVVKRLSRFKYKDVEADFSEQVDAISTQADLVGHHNTDSIQIVQKPEAVDIEASSFLRVAEISPQAAVLSSWPMVESAIERAATRVGSEYPPGSPSIKIMQALVSDGHIVSSVGNLYNNLRHLRNQAAHSDDIDINLAAAETYVSMILKLVKSIDSIAPNSV